jgi:hypothetical protein
MPAPELAIRKKLGEALMTFVGQMTKMATDDVASREPHAPPVNFDEAMRRHITEIYRQAVEEAAAEGIQVDVAWHTLAFWTEEGKERIGYFSRALECVESGRNRHLQPRTVTTEWTDVHMRADCLFEIGRVHAHEGDPAIAREFLLRALPLAQEAERMAVTADIECEDPLEGRIAELLVQLPDEADEAKESHE